MKKIAILSILMAGGIFAGANLGATPLPQAAPAVSTATTDRDATQKIRKAIVGDKTLSMYAHNVTILTKAGKVTLRGPVRSEEEKQTVASMASAVVGADNVSNELTIQPSK